MSFCEASESEKEVQNVIRDYCPLCCTCDDVCVCARARACVCVYVCEGEREREREWKDNDYLTEFSQLKSYCLRQSLGAKAGAAGTFTLAAI